MIGNTEKRMIKISKEEEKILDSVLNSDLKKYYFHPPEFSKSVEFSNGVSAKIVFVLKGGKPYVEGILYRNGREICILGPSASFIGRWNFGGMGMKTEYIVDIGVE